MVCGKKTHRCLLLVNNIYHTIWSGTPQLFWLLVSFDGNYPTTSNLVVFRKAMSTSVCTTRHTTPTRRHVFRIKSQQNRGMCIMACLLLVPTSTSAAYFRDKGNNRNKVDHSHECCDVKNGHW